ncbi:MAG: sugar phosphate nucleotidyltransferase [Methanosarcina sp.]
MQAIILAGGRGRRLLPYTTVIPKPLMPVGEKPILEIVLTQLKNYGFQKATIAVGYLAEFIEAYFKNGERIGININYSREFEPLGTAGPISLIEDLDNDFLVMNGDILTNINYQKFIDYHKESHSIATIAVCVKEVPISLGVIKANDHDELIDYIEKPTLKYEVSMGIYAFNKRILDYIEKSKYLDFPDLIKKVIKNNEVVKVYHSNDYWLDIGRPEDYEKALNEFEGII